jgi:CRP/FNR family transcriptional regulator
MLASCLGTRSARVEVEERPCRRGQVLFREWEEPTHLFFLCSGLVKLTKPSPRGRDIITRLHFPGEPVGLASLLAGEPYPETATCVQAGLVCALRREDFLRVVQACPDLLVALLRAESDSEAFMHEMMARMAVEPVESRAARALLMLAQRLGQPGPRGLEFHMPLSRADFGRLIGTSAESAMRILSRMRQQGLISERGRRIVLGDLEPLRAWASGVVRRPADPSPWHGV